MSEYAKLQAAVKFWQNQYNRNGTGYTFLQQAKNAVKEMEDSWGQDSWAQPEEMGYISLEE